MRSAWVAILCSGCVALAFIACSSFEEDATGNPGDLDAAADGDQADTAPVGDAGPGPDACVGKDLASDPAHCGACGHDCLGGKCSDGGCGPVRVAIAANNVTSVAVTDAGVFWVTGGDAISTCPLDGCTDAGAAVHAMGFSTASTIVSVGNDLGVVAPAAAEGVYVVTADGIKRRIPGGYTSIRSIASDDDKTVYFVAYEGSMKLWRYETTGDGGTKSILDDANLAKIGVAGSHVYYSRAGGSEAMGVCDAPTCANPRDLVMGTIAAVNTVQLAPTKDALFWLRIEDNMLDTCSVNGCSLPDIVISGTELRSLATDDKYVYFSTGAGGTVERCPQTGCSGKNRVPLATGAHPGSLLVAGKALYWTTENDGSSPPAIWRIAR